ncbi:hypothetical protein [Paracoccus cavernae]
MSDIASLLFPSESPIKPAPPAQQGQQDDKADAAALLFATDDPALAPTLRPEAARDGFTTEAAPDPAAAVADILTPWADGLQAEGATERADEMRDVSEALAADFRESGLSPEDTGEIMGLAREALGNIIMPGVPVSDERLADMRADAEVYIAENQISPDDIGLAQRLVRDLDAKTGGKVSTYLIDTGMGNDPRAIQRAVEIAKRRYH